MFASNDSARVTKNYTLQTNTGVYILGLSLKVSTPLPVNSSPFLGRFTQDNVFNILALKREFLFTMNVFNVYWICNIVFFFLSVTPWINGIYFNYLQHYLLFLWLNARQRKKLSLQKKQTFFI